jgi:hypothetical protein
MDHVWTFPCTKGIRTVYDNVALDCTVKKTYKMDTKASLLIANLDGHTQSINLSKEEKKS